MRIGNLGVSYSLDIVAKIVKRGRVRERSLQSVELCQGAMVACARELVRVAVRQQLSPPHHTAGY